MGFGSSLAASETGVRVHFPLSRNRGQAETGVSETGVRVHFPQRNRGQRPLRETGEKQGSEKQGSECTFSPYVSETGVRDLFLEGSTVEDYLE